MKLIEDLGVRAVGRQGRRARYGLYECPVCHKHFECITADVKRGNTTKCKSCANKIRNVIRSNKAASEFIEKARTIHGDLYEYLLADYVSTHTKVTITCQIHGVFEQTPNAHLSGQGCPHCAKERSNIALRMSEKNDKPTLLYYVYFPEVSLWKIGCTSKTVEERFRLEKLEYIIIQTKEYTSGTEAYRVEKLILDATKAYQFKGTMLQGGNTELRTQPVENFEELIAHCNHASSSFNGIVTEFLTESP